MVVSFIKFLSMLILPVLLTTTFLIAAEAQSTTGHGTFTCKTYGRYPDPNDCKAYFECLPTFTSARLIAKKQQCPAGKGFHDKLKKCVSLQKLKECATRQGRFEKNNAVLNPLCATPDVHFVCADCQTLVHCIEGVAYVTQCDASLSCSVTDPFDNGVCAPNQRVEECSCSGGSSNSYRPDPYDKTKFFTCDSAESLPEIFECPVNRVFDDSLQKCIDGEGLPSCSAEGTFSVPENCTKYYSCLQTKYSWLQKSYECEPNQMFSESRGQCEDPCEWQNEDFKCTKEGRFNNPNDCKTFFVCILNGTDYILKQRSCPNLHNWLSNADNTSGKCTDDLSLCKPIAPHHCDIPADYCPASESVGAADTNTIATEELTTTTTQATLNETENEVSGAVDTPTGDGSSPNGASDTSTGEATAPEEGTAAEDAPVTEEVSANVDTSTIEENESSGDGAGTADSPVPILRTGPEQLKKEDPIAFIRNLLNRP